jgi:hypothetical protein
MIQTTSATAPAVISGARSRHLVIGWFSGTVVRRAPTR